jgi:predicted Rossmann fold flavoprotein
LIAVVGGGASGLFYTALSKERVSLFESQPKIGSKILVSGGGRCNITNRTVDSSFYSGDSRFFNAVYRQFTNYDFLKFLKKRGLNPKEESGGKLFCKNSKRVVEMLQREVGKQQLFLNEKVSDIEKSEEVFTIITDRRKIKAEKVIIATGGLAYPQIGATDIGLKIAEKFGHRVVKPSPALVGFTVQREQFWFKELSGLSLPVEISVEEKSISGDLLFTHRGVSGPAILNSSLYWKKGALIVNFSPEVSFQTALKKYREKTPLTAFGLPKRFMYSFLESVGLDVKKLRLYTSSELNKLQQIESYSFSPAGNFGYKKAEISRGGVSTDEVDSRNMESKIVPNLHFIGEVLDINGEVGGYNLQWAWSSAYSAVFG